MTASRSTWTLADMPDQAGRTALVTGVSPGGLGYVTALELARRGARVVLAGRSPDKVAAAAGQIDDEIPGARLDRLILDLADLSSVRQAAEAAQSFGSLDVLVNNAGVMAPPYARTVDGFELQMGTNHFGPFLLTGLLLDQIAASADGRVVTVSSQMHRMATRAPLEDPRVQRGRYLRWPEYARSKLANLLFTLELDRRAAQHGLPVRALAAHPGFSGTHLAANGTFGRAAGGAASILDASVKALAQSPQMGALPTLMAATADLPGSSYCGPSGPGQMSGLPRVVDCGRLARDADAQEQLWRLSEGAVGLSWP